MRIRKRYLILPENEWRIVLLALNRLRSKLVGIWSQRHLRWMKQNWRVTYINLLTTGKLYDYLYDIDTQANEQLELLVGQMAKAEGVTNQMKAEKQMEWGRRMNSIRSRAEEIVFNEIVLT